jgi:hypothetical protein
MDIIKMPMYRANVARQIHESQLETARLGLQQQQFGLSAQEAEATRLYRQKSLEQDAERIAIEKARQQSTSALTDEQLRQMQRQRELFSIMGGAGRLAGAYGQAGQAPTDVTPYPKPPSYAPTPDMGGMPAAPGVAPPQPAAPPQVGGPGMMTPFPGVPGGGFTQDQQRAMMELMMGSPGGLVSVYRSMQPGANLIPYTTYGGIYDPTKGTSVVQPSPRSAYGGGYDRNVTAAWSVLKDPRADDAAKERAQRVIDDYFSFGPGEFGGQGAGGVPTYVKGQMAVNPETGETMVFDGNIWQMKQQ